MMVKNIIVALFHLFAGLLAQELFPTWDPFSYYTYFVLASFLVLLYPISVLGTIKGYIALMDESPGEDGSVSDPDTMLDGIKGKLKEVVCEAAPQSLLQVLFDQLLYFLIFFLQVYILMKAGIQGSSHVFGTILSLISLIKVNFFENLDHRI